MSLGPIAVRAIRRIRAHRVADSSPRSSGAELHGSGYLVAEPHLTSKISRGGRASLIDHINGILQIKLKSISL